ncbi:MAG: filamentous hemagglutinin N-terminal domain-containing protein, partial [Proteobacteria bacterium]|nr:filamentous hemagglutinin N-terminal domain-containing protein [Pseudomonadota bacterium]
MHTKEELCEKIKKVFPEIGACGINLMVDYDKQNKVWVVDLKKDNHERKTFLDESEAQQCMDGKQCVSLGLQIGQLMKKNRYKCSIIGAGPGGLQTASHHVRYNRKAILIDQGGGRTRYALHIENYLGLGITSGKARVDVGIRPNKSFFVFEMMAARGNHVSLLWRQITVAAAFACLFAAGQAQANGTNPTVVEGQASFSTLGSSLNIVNSPGAIINWQGFSIGAGETTRFIQQSAASSVLNRVIGPDPSSILGTLTSNGRVFLINPSGILVGQGAHIDVAGLVASTLNLSNQDFLAGRLNFADNSLAGTVENQGSITTPSGGSVYLVGSSVTNSGIINSPQGDVILAAGQSVKIFDSSTPGVRVEVTANDNSVVNLGEILAQSGEIGIYGAVLRNAGIIDADQVVREAGGKIVLRAKQDVTLETGSRLSANGEQGGEITVQSESGTTQVSGTIEANGTDEVAGKGGIVQLLGNRVSLMAANVDASGPTGGGTVLIGGDYQGKNLSVQNALATLVSSDSSVKVDAITSGNGGKVIVWSDSDTSIGGTLTARGGANSGDGGFIETSGKHLLLADGTRVNTLAPHGKTGRWLLDPVNWTIAAAGDETAANVVASLATTDREILADNDITVDDAIAWVTGQTLILNAGHDVLVNAAMTASTIGAGIELIAGNDVIAISSLVASANTAVIDVSAGRNVSVTTVTANGGGSVNLRAGNDLIVNGVISTDTNLDSVILRADNDGTGPGVAGGTVKFVGSGSVVTPRAIIRFNPDGYVNTSAEIAYYDTKVSALLDARAWVFAQGNNKTYDGTNAATLSFKGTPTDGGAVTLVDPGSGATFSDKNAVAGKTVTYAGFTLGGGDSGRFSLFGDGSGTATADINKAALSVTATSVTKTYDGTLAATGTGTVGAIAGAGDVVNNGGSQAFLDKNFGIGNKIVRASGVTIKDALDADMSGNY